MKSFDEWKEEQERIHNDYDAENAWYAGAQSRQAEIDAMKEALLFQVQMLDEKQKKIDNFKSKIAIYENHIASLKKFHDGLNCLSDGAYVVGLLDGFFFCLENEIRGIKNENN